MSFALNWASKKAAGTLEVGTGGSYLSISLTILFARQSTDLLAEHLHQIDMQCIRLALRQQLELQNANSIIHSKTLYRLGNGLTLHRIPSSRSERS